MNAIMLRTFHIRKNHLCLRDCNRALMAMTMIGPDEPYSGISTNYNEDTLLFSMSQQLFCADTTIQAYSLQNDFSILVLSGLQLLQRSFLLQLSTNRASLFPFRSTFGALDFCFGFLSLSTFRSFPFEFASHFRLRILFCSFLLVQFNSAVIQNPDVAIHVPMASVK